MTNAPPTPEQDLDLLNRLADAARAPALAHFRIAGLSVDNKHAATGGYDPVTAADREVEQAIRAILAAERPDDGIIGEEYPNIAGRTGRAWVIDPIDGTRAYVCGAPTWGVLIALNVDGAPTLGVMDQPFTGERFIGGPANGHGDGRGGATWTRGADTRRLQTRACADLSQATLLTTDPRLFHGDSQSAFAAIEAQCRTSRYGLDCYGYALVALGGADLVVEASLSAYDIQALIPIIEAAGGVVTTWEGDSAADGGRVVAAGSAAIHAQALAILAENRSIPSF